MIKPFAKPLLVGESNPYQRTADAADRYALYPDPPNSAGGRLCFKIFGISERAYLSTFDRTNLCHPSFSMTIAKERALAILNERCSAEVIILFGAKVAQAFRLEYKPFAVFTDPLEKWPVRVVLPHPSGRNHAWNAAGAIDRARHILAMLDITTSPYVTPTSPDSAPPSPTV